VTVYLLHLESKLKHAGHYLGSAEDVSRRLTDHAKGEGSKMMAAVVREGIAFKLARRWDNVPRWFEAKLHRRKENPYFCPVCVGEIALTRAQWKGGGNNAK
jgi:hypothetical protein